MNNTIYNIDFSLVAERLSPPSKRTLGLLKWLKALLTPVQWLRNSAMDYYANGVPITTAPFYKSTSTYAYGDWVIAADDKVYQNIYSAGTTHNIVPTNGNYWLPVLDTYIGVRERLVYNSQTIVLEAILNKKFRVPPLNYVPTGDEPEKFPLIYIDNKDNDLDFVYFYNSDEGYPGIHFQNSYEPFAIPVYFYYEMEYIPAFDFIVMVPELLKGFYPPEPVTLELEDPLDPLFKDPLLRLVEAETNKYSLLGIKFKAEYFV